MNDIEMIVYELMQEIDDLKMANEALKEANRQLRSRNERQIAMLQDYADALTRIRKEVLNER